MTRDEYTETVDSIAAACWEAHVDNGSELHDEIWEHCGNDNTDAVDVMAHTSNPDAYFDTHGKLSASNYREALAAMAHEALTHDVYSAAAAIQSEVEDLDLFDVCAALVESVAADKAGADKAAAIRALSNDTKQLRNLLTEHCEHRLTDKLESELIDLLEMEADAADPSDS